MDNKLDSGYEEKIIKPISGFIALSILIVAVLGSIALMVYGASVAEAEVLTLPAGIGIFGGIALMSVSFIFICPALKTVKPNEAMVLTLFGKYYGSVKADGFYAVNPFCTRINPAATNAVAAAVASSKKPNTDVSVSMASLLNKNLSLKAMTLNNAKQKINDEDGNPIEIGVIVIWRIINTAYAVFNVDNYEQFVSTQCDSAIRHVARQYPYDVSSGGDEKSLRGSSSEIAEVLKAELQTRVNIAGIEIMEARISHLAYAPEIAAAMLQRQQATAIIVARQKIVEGAVGMVEMALNKLSENNIVELDAERKAQMVSNLLVVLCGNKDAQPIVNSGTIY